MYSNSVAAKQPFSKNIIFSSLDLRKYVISSETHLPRPNKNIQSKRPSLDLSSHFHVWVYSIHFVPSGRGGAAVTSHTNGGGGGGASTGPPPSPPLISSSRRHFVLSISSHPETLASYGISNYYLIMLIAQLRADFHSFPPENSLANGCWPRIIRGVVCSWKSDEFVCFFCEFQNKGGCKLWWLLHKEEIKENIIKRLRNC